MKRLQNFSIVLGIAQRDHRLDQRAVKIEVNGGRVLEAYNIKIKAVKKGRDSVVRQVLKRWWNGVA